MSKNKNYKNVQKNNKYNKKKPEPTTNKLFLLPIVFIMSILPFIVYLANYNTTLTKFTWFSQTGAYNDFFLYYKQTFFIIVSVIIVILISIRAANDKNSLKAPKVFIPLCAYAILSLLSSLCSKYSSYTYTGSFAQFESVFVLLGYCLTVYYIYLFVSTEEDFKFIFFCFMISIFIMGLIGFTQFIGHDIYATNAFKRLITPSKYWDQLSGISFAFDAKQVFLTLYNPNYAGVYASFLLPIIFIFILYTKNKKMLFLYIPAAVLMILCVIGSRSAAGIIGIGISIIFFLIIYWRKFKKFRIIPILLIVAFVLSAFFYNNLNHNVLVNKLNTQFKFAKTNPNLTDIQTNKDNLVIKYKGNIMKIKFDVNSDKAFHLTITDNADKPISYTNDPKNQGACIIQDKRFPGFTVSPCMYNKTISFYVQIDGKQWFFTNQVKDRTYYYMNKYGRFDKIVTAPSALFTGHENFATNRGYIWSRTIPLIKKYVIVGSGADTFISAFPQRDYVNLHNFGFSDEIITRPHCLYLQIAIQTGLLSLIAFLLFYILYFISSIRLYIKGKLDNYYAKIGAGIMVGTFSYMICGLSNDSCIAIAPVFWALMGLGIVANIKAKKEFDKEQIELKK